MLINKNSINNHKRSAFTPFGYEQAGRGYTKDNARYSFNGMEKDKEIAGDNSSLDFGARFLNTKVGRWFSTDPLEKKYPFASPYNFALNTPIWAKDPDGELVLFFNGYVDDENKAGKKGYWQGLDKAVMNQLGVKSAIYYDGSMGGPKGTPSSIFLFYRYNEGLEKGRDKETRDLIYNMLDKTVDKDGKATFTESIKTISHSMGTMFERGFMEGLMEDERFANVVLESRTDFDAFEGSIIFQPKNAKGIFLENNAKVASGGFSLASILSFFTGIPQGSENITTKEEKENATHFPGTFNAEGISPSSMNNKNPKEDVQIETGSGASKESSTEKK